MRNIYNIDPSKMAQMAPIRSTVPKEPIHPPVKAKKKSPSPEPRTFAPAKATPKKVIATPTMKEKQD
jgi:hypothetical protein